MRRENLSSLCPTSPILCKEAHIPCWDRSTVSPVSHGPCAQQDNAFATTQHFSRLGHTPFWHLCVPKGAEMTSLRGGEPFAPLPAGFRRLLWPPLPEHDQLLCLLTCVCDQLQGLCVWARRPKRDITVERRHPVFFVSRPSRHTVSTAFEQQLSE